MVRSCSTVLLIEADASLRRLIALGLRQRSVHVLEARSLDDLPDLERQPPDLLLLDVDANVHRDRPLLAAARRIPLLAALPVVLLSWDGSLVDEDETPTSPLACLAKPFDARTLHMTIERLLEEHEATRVAEVQTVAVSPAPSLCPMITAAGLLLVIIGLMVQLIIAGVGLLVVLAALLYWTLGSRPTTPSSTLPIMIGQAPAGSASVP